MTEEEDRYLGCLLGLAVGDAVGTTVEFKPRGSFAPVTDMVGGGPFGLLPGQWTDDTAMALCLGASLVGQRGFDPDDQMRRYVDWMANGSWSSTGACFDIGNTVSSALHEYLETGNPFSGSSDPFSAGNGSIMRLAPVPMYFSPDFGDVLRYSGQSSMTTHGAPECVDACQLLGGMLHIALGGGTKEDILEKCAYRPFTTKIKKIAAGAYFTKTEEQIHGTGYVVESLEAALWCFQQTNSFAEAILKATNLGDDSDTTAAVCGQVAGAYYGRSAIPADWLAKLALRKEIEKMALALMAGPPQGR